MSSELIKNNSVCNYNSLATYNGTARLPFTLNNISVSYPVRDLYQVVPIFAATGDYSAPNYNTLVKGSCYNYAGINQAYTDCSDPASSQGCSLAGGQCVVYKVRPCSGPERIAPPSYIVDPLTQQCYADYSQVPDMSASPVRYGSITDCMANAGSGSSLRPPSGPLFAGGATPAPTTMAPMMPSQAMPTQASMGMPTQASMGMPMAMPTQASMAMPTQASMAMPMAMPTQASMGMPSQAPMGMPSQAPMVLKRSYRG